MTTSIRQDALNWANSMRWKNQIGRYKIAKSADSPTLLSANFAALVQALYGNAYNMNNGERCLWIEIMANHQNPESGIFEDPTLYPKDMGAVHDLNYITWQTTFFGLSALSALGGEPLYPLTFLDDFLAENDVTEWLANLNWQNPWLISNNIMFLLSFLIQEGERREDDNLIDMAHQILDWLDAHQDPETGYWGTEQGVDLQNAMAGAFHFYFFYFYLKRPISHIDRIIDSTLSLQESDGLYQPGGGGSACLDYDAIDILVKLSMLTGYRATEVFDSLAASHRAILKLRNPDGGFCESKRPDMWPKSRKRRLLELFGITRLLNRPWVGRPVEYLAFSGWNKMRYRVDESDLWSTWFRGLAVALIESRYSEYYRSDNTWVFPTLPVLGWHDMSQVTAMLGQRELVR